MTCTFRFFARTLLAFGLVVPLVLGFAGLLVFGGCFAAAGGLIVSWRGR